MAYLYLSIAIVTEVIGTIALKASAQFTKLFPSMVVVVGYGVSFYFMALVLILQIFLIFFILEFYK